MKRKPLSLRAKARLAKMRRDPHGRVSLEIARYLGTMGWVVVVAGRASVRGFVTGPLAKYEFVLEFTGARVPPPTIGLKAPRRKATR